MEKLEIWKDIKGFEGYYQVSNYGRVKSLKRVIYRKDGKKLPVSEKILSGSKDTKGYLQVELKKNNERYILCIHRLVANAFIENQNNLPQVNHIDGNKLNNKVENLEWCTCKENIIHSWKTGLCKSFKGEKHPNHKLTWEQVKYIKKYYIPKDKNYGGRAIAKKFNISTTPIRNIINGKGWIE